MDATPPGGPPTRTPIDIDSLPWYKSPWLWGAVIGIASVTLLRPCTQYIPEPLPVIGEAPQWMASAIPDDAPAALVTFWEEGCDPCVTTIKGLAEVTRRSSWAEAQPEVRILTRPGVSLDAIAPIYAYEEGWDHVVITPPDTWSTGVFAPHIPANSEQGTKWTDFIHIGNVWIVDHRGGIRGPLSAKTPDGISEIYHRTQRVIHELFDASETGP